MTKPTLKSKQEPPSSIKDKSDELEIAMTSAQLQDGPTSRALGGSYDDRFNFALMNDVLRTFWHPEGDEEFRTSRHDIGLASLVSIRPSNELEGLVAAQIVAAHAASLECYRRAAIPDQTFEGRKSNLGLAFKASRTFAALTETLQKLRGESGKQTMHVHHHNSDNRTQVAANQAVMNVGQPADANQPTGAPTCQGGGEKNTTDQPHEQKAIKHDPAEAFDLGSSMRREKPEGAPVSGASDERQEKMQTTRRKKPRSTKGSS